MSPDDHAAARKAERRRLLAEADELWRARRSEEALEVYERCLPLFAEEDRDSSEYATFCNNFACPAVAVGQLGRAEALFKAAYPIYRREGQAGDLARVDFNLGNVYRAMGQRDLSTDHYRTALAAARKLDDDRLAGQCLVTLALNAIGVGRIEDARASLAEVDRLPEAVRNDPELRWSYLFQRSKIALHDRDHDAALAAMEESLATAHRLGDRWYIAQAEEGLGEIRRRIEARKRSPPQPRAAPAAADEPPLEPLLPGFDPAELERFGEMAQQAGAQTVFLPLAGQVVVVTAGGPPGATLIDAAAPDLLARLDREGMLDDPAAAPQWLAHARHSVDLGIARRERGELAEAYLHQRFALFVALRRRDARGVATIAGNVWIVRESIRDVTERARGPWRGSGDRAARRDYLELMRRTLRFIRHDARLVAAAVRELADDPANDPPTRLATLHTWHRFALMAGDHGSLAAAGDELLALADEIGDPEVPLIAAAEEVAQMDLLEALRAGGARFDGDGPEAAPAEAWPRYQTLRPRIAELEDPARFAIACHGAFEHLCALRLEATTAGGAFGHELSYVISSLLQRVGRDLVGLLHRLGEDETALGVAETLLARSMADWMSRTHAAWAFSPEFLTFGGSLNAVPVAGRAEIQAAVRDAGAPLLYYLRQGDRLLAWLVRTDGRVVAAEAESPAGHLAYLLPALASAERELDGSKPAREQRAAIDRELAALHDTLFPPPIREALADQGERLVIVADPAVQSIPFCALRTPEGRYLVEDRELVFWPSVTAWLTLEAGARRTPAQRARLREAPPPLVIGVRSFEGEIRLSGARGEELLSFDELPYASREARQVAEILGTEPVLDDDATVGAVFARGRGADIVHIATHGYLDEAHPRRSFLVLSDGTLTADALYRRDQGLQTHLVVLSACETALGGGHPDSVVGLANAFLIAGAGSVLSTLWPIADEATRTFMSTFYGALEEREDLPSALRLAQLALLAGADTADPYFWAPFKLTGRAANPLAAALRG